MAVCDLYAPTLAVPWPWHSSRAGHECGSHHTILAVVAVSPESGINRGQAEVTAGTPSPITAAAGDLEWDTNN